MKLSFLKIFKKKPVDKEKIKEAERLRLYRKMILANYLYLCHVNNVQEDEATIRLTEMSHFYAYQVHCMFNLDLHINLFSLADDMLKAEGG